MPKMRIENSYHEPNEPKRESFKILAPSITGILRKNENSAAMCLEVPSKSPPMMVAPERDVPGINAKT